jgi:hypothetical protein
LDQRSALAKQGADCRRYGYRRLADQYACLVRQSGVSRIETLHQWLRQSVEMREYAEAFLRPRTLEKHAAERPIEAEELTDDELVAKCIDYVVDGEETFSVENESVEEISSFIEDLPIDVMDKMRAFFQQMPRIEHTVEYKCPHCESDNAISINGYEHFFG